MILIRHKFYFVRNKLTGKSFIGKYMYLDPTTDKHYFNEANTDTGFATIYTYQILQIAMVESPQIDGLNNFSLGN